MVINQVYRLLPCLMLYFIAPTLQTNSGLTKKGRRRRPFVTDRERREKRFAV
ncbi:hypothetical protein [Paraburkholderia sediminicola]|uniref:hypothetical protein n=1 Tax=Paraburkholderia sediminicola TaxID=458836 RepID=UPI0038B8C518